MSKPILSTEERIAALTVLCERLIDTHANVAMDTSEDQRLHDRAVEMYRLLLKTIKDAP